MMVSDNSLFCAVHVAPNGVILSGNLNDDVAAIQFSRVSHSDRITHLEIFLSILDRITRADLNGSQGVLGLNSHCELVLSAQFNGAIQSITLRWHFRRWE